MCTEYNIIKIFKKNCFVCIDMDMDVWSKIKYKHEWSDREKRGQTVNRYKFEKHIVLIIG